MWPWKILKWLPAPNLISIWLIEILFFFSFSSPNPQLNLNSNPNLDPNRKSSQSGHSNNCLVKLKTRVASYWQWFKIIYLSKMHMLNVQIILNLPINYTFHFDRSVFSWAPTAETLLISFTVCLCSLSGLESDGSERQVRKPPKISLYCGWQASQFWKQWNCLWI